MKHGMENKQIKIFMNILIILCTTYKLIKLPPLAANSAPNGKIESIVEILSGFKLKN